MKDGFDFNKISKANKLLLNLGKISLPICILGVIMFIVEGSGEVDAMIGAILILIMPFIFITFGIKDKLNFDKQLKNIDIEQLKQELRKPSAKVFKPTLKEFEDIYLLDNFIFQQGTGVANFNDIFWVYTKEDNLPGYMLVGTHTSNSINSGNWLIIILNNKQKVTIKLGPYYRNTPAIIDYIKQKNKNVLVGNSPENMEKFKNIK